MSKEERRITVGELRAYLKVYSDDYEISFSGLTFSRVKQRGEKFLQIEFEEQVYRDENGHLVVEEV